MRKNNDNKNVPGYDNNKNKQAKVRVSMTWLTKRKNF